MISKHEITESLNKVYLASKDAHSIYTPLELCEEMINSIDDYDDKTILVISNIEFLIVLKQKLVDMNNVHYSTSCSVKKKDCFEYWFKHKQYTYFTV